MLLLLLSHSLSFSFYPSLFEHARSIASLKDPPRKDWSLLNGLNECKSKAPAMLATLFVYDPTGNPARWSSLFDVFPRLQVTKARRRTTSSPAIIPRLKGSPGYVHSDRKKKNFAGPRFSGKLYDFKEHSREVLVSSWWLATCTRSLPHVFLSFVRGVVSGFFFYRAKR